MRLNDLNGGIYAEPYAGGGGAALWLLFGEYVDRIRINDADPCVYEFWNSVLRRTDDFLDLLERTKPTPAEWRRQKEIYGYPRHHARLRVGFATFFLNRCNRSGVISRGGMIGGNKQTGEWKIDARFNKTELAARIRKIALFRDRITLTNEDGLHFLNAIGSDRVNAARTFVYLDPPYYRKGSQLYLNFYDPEDHAALARMLRTERRFPWVLSYDNVSEVRALYKGMHQLAFDLDYSAHNGRVGKEIMIYPDSIRFPEKWKARIPSKYVTAADGVVIPIGG
jgi:DNA adenine methylase